MSRVPVRRPSAALIVSTVALAVALGGTSYAAFSLPKNSVGTKQLRDGAVSTAKLKNGAVTKAKLDVTGVTVPDAVFANSAGSATSASSAASATNATNLGGSPASAFRDHCPTATTLAAPSLCVTNADVGTGAPSGNNTWDGAAHDCAALGMELPTPSQGLLLGPTLGKSSNFWTDDFWVTGSPPASYALYVNSAIDDLFQASTSDSAEVRCVTTPSNS